MKVIVIAILTFFLGTMFIGLFHMSTNMSMVGMEDCPFMAHDEIVCPMNLADHIGAWKSVFLAVIPNTLLLFLVIGTIALITAIAPHLFVPKRWSVQKILFTQLRERIYTFYHRLLQEFFSDGILNPKLF